MVLAGVEDSSRALRARAKHPLVQWHLCESAVRQDPKCWTAPSPRKASRESAGEVGLGFPSPRSPHHQEIRKGCWELVGERAPGRKGVPMEIWWGPGDWSPGGNFSRRIPFF